MLDQTTDLAGRLSRPDLICTQAYVGGDWRDGPDGKTFDVVNPARGDVLAQVADLSREQARVAIDAAAQLIAAKLDDKGAAKLVDDAIGELPKRLAH